MVIFVKFLNAMIALAASVYGYIRFHNILTAILIYLAVYEFVKALNALLLNYYFQHIAKVNPDPVLHPFQDRFFDKIDEKSDKNPLERGMRLLVATEDLDSEEYLPYFKEMERIAIEHLDQPETIFNLRYHFVLDRELPYQAVWCVCGKDGKHINRCIKTWYKTNALVLMTVKQPNREIFVYDGEMDIEGVGKKRYSVFFVFEQALPVTIKKKTEEAPKVEETKQIEE